MIEAKRDVRRHCELFLLQWLFISNIFKCRCLGWSFKPIYVGLPCSVPSAGSPALDKAAARAAAPTGEPAAKPAAEKELAAVDVAANGLCAPFETVAATDLCKTRESGLSMHLNGKENGWMQLRTFST